MIFLSHTFADKPVVEPIAIALRDIFGEDQVFYDAWSIKPGDGIISKMNKGLSNPEFVFYFVSKASLASEMVDLEWQNALYKATKGECKIIPVRVDGSEMPALLSQTVYIDMFQYGLDVAKQRIVSLVQGVTGFQPAHEQFSNLTWKAKGDPKSVVTVTITASHFMEPNPRFFAVLDNGPEEIELSFQVGGFWDALFKDEIEEDGIMLRGWLFSPLGGAITPDHPLVFTLSNKNNTEVKLLSIMHTTGPNTYDHIPKTHGEH
tara:strand:+ start:583 stop:1368 length:786 start_codon:yes stop_codon:yes gene_type:complete